MGRYISEQDWGDLLTSIALKECILIIGPQLSTLCLEDGRIESLTTHFAQQLAVFLPTHKVCDSHNLSHVADNFIRESNNLTRFKGYLQSFYSREYEPNPALMSLAKLPFRLIINTAPDDLICKAFRLQNRYFREAFYNFDMSGIQEEPLYDPREETPFIYHLFGNYKNPGSVVITESQQIEFVQQIVQKEHKIPNSIHNVFRESNNYLFIGFDFSDWYLRLLLKVLNPKEESKIPISFALQHHNTMSETSTMFFSNRFKLTFFADDSGVFANELCNRLQTGIEAPKTLMVANTGKNKKTLLLNTDMDFKWRHKFIEGAVSLYKMYDMHIAEVQPGDIVKVKLQEIIYSSNFVFPIITSSFIAQYYDFWEEQIVPLHCEGRTLVVPILAEETLWDALPFISTMPCLPRTKKPVSSWDNQHEAWRHIMEELGIILKHNT